MNNAKHLRTGGDPRALPDYAALRDELSKLSHPARPDVNWRYAEMLCLRLFEHNGVDLQTAAWYTLARIHIAGLEGLNEGLALTEALLAYQWSLLWPARGAARVSIINGLNQRLQNPFRTLTLNDPAGLSLLCQIEHKLAAIAQILARHELKQDRRAEILQQQIRQAITRLKNRLHNESGEALSAQVIPPLPDHKAPELQRRIYVMQPETTGAVAMPARRTKPFFSITFLAGLSLGVVLMWSWNSLNQPSSTEQQFTASLTPLPATLSLAQLITLRQASWLTGQAASHWFERTQHQLSWLMKLSTDWPLQYGEALIAQTATLWPDSQPVAIMQQAWQQKISANASTLVSLNSWHEGMNKLQQLTDKLNGLDEKRGKYMTISELKSVVYAAMQTFNRSIPAEEMLRRYAFEQQKGLASDIQLKQTEMALQQLQYRYFLLKQTRGKAVKMSPAGIEPATSP